MVGMKKLSSKNRVPGGEIVLEGGVLGGDYCICVIISLYGVCGYAFLEFGLGRTHMYSYEYISLETSRL